MKKTYTGDIQGESTVEFVMAYRDDGSATYVGMERVVGSLGGKTGSFVLQSAGTFEGRASRRPAVSVVPGSGTGDLSGLTGTSREEARANEEHAFLLDYEIA